MNLLARKIGLIAGLLLSSIFIISCEDPGEIGLNIDPDNGIVVTRYYETVLPTTMVQLDPRETYQSPAVQAGKYTDPDFGTVVTKTFSRLNLTNAKPTLAETAAFKEFVLDISFGSIYGDRPVSGGKSTIHIYQLQDELDTAGSYTRLSELPYDEANPLATWDFYPVLNDTLRADSVYQIPVSTTVGRDLFDKLKEGDPIFDSNDSFNAYIRGIAIVPDDNNNSIFFINSGNFRFRLRYSQLNSEGEEVESEIGFNLLGERFFYLDSDKTGTPLEGITADNSDFTPTTDYLYSQLGTLVALKIDFSAFYNIADTLDYMILNKAEITVGRVEEFNDEKAPFNEMNAYFTGDNNFWPEKSPDGSEFVTVQRESPPFPPGNYGLPQPIEFDSARLYNVELSYFLQNLHAGKFENVGSGLEKETTIFLLPETDVLRPEVFPVFSRTNQFKVHKDSVRLKIHYTIPRPTQGNN